METVQGTLFQPVGLIMINFEKERENIVKDLIIRLRLLENGNLSVENMAKLIADYFISLQKYT
mgnify:CR=1 FL=1